MLVDFHTHFFCRSFFEALAQDQTVADDPAAALAAVSQKAGLDLPNPDPLHHAQSWLERMQTNQVDHMVIFASLPQEAPDVAKVIGAHPEKLSGFALVNPKVPEAAQKVTDLKNKGFKGLLFFPAMHNYHVQSKEVAPVFEAAAAAGLICLTHFGMLQVKLRDLLGLPRPFDLSFANPLDLLPLANRHPETPFVIPHFGCGFFRETLMVGTQCENVYVDTSSSNSWMATQPEDLSLSKVFKKTLGVFGDQRILFGTDSSVFPRGWRADLFDEQKEAMQEAGFSKEAQQKVLGENAQHLLGL